MGGRLALHHRLNPLTSARTQDVEGHHNVSESWRLVSCRGVDLPVSPHQCTTLGYQGCSSRS